MANSSMRGLLETLAGECESRGAKALAVPTDVGEQAEVERLARAAIKRFGRIDARVNDAGVGALGPFERLPLDLHGQVVKTSGLGGHAASSPAKSGRPTDTPGAVRAPMPQGTGVSAGRR